MGSLWSLLKVNIVDAPLVIRNRHMWWGGGGGIGSWDIASHNL